MHDGDLGDLGLHVGKDYYLLCLSTQLMSLFTNDLMSHKFNFSGKL